MTRPRRDDGTAYMSAPLSRFTGSGFSRSPEEATDHGYQPGGRIGQMHADLAQRFGQSFAMEQAVTSVEQPILRFLSVASGYLALLTGYVGMGFLIVH